VQTFTIAAARHQAAGEFVDDDDFPFLDDIVAVALEQDAGLQGLFQMMNFLDSAFDIDIAEAEQLLHLADAAFG